MSDSPTSTEQRVLAALDTDAMVRFIQELVRIPSQTGTEGENVAQECVAAWMQNHGLEVDCWELDFAQLANHPACSVEYDRKRGLGVAGMIGGEMGATDEAAAGDGGGDGGGGGGGLIFNGHVDVVPEGDAAAWRDGPFDGVVRDGKVYGRGSLDMKGGLCCALYAAAAIRDAGVKLKKPLTVLSVIGEEDGGVGTLAAVLRGYRGDGAVVVEPTDLVVVPSQAGALNFRIKIPGLAAHGAMRNEGVSAIEKFFPVYEALMGLERKRHHDLPADPLFARYAQPHGICVGTIRGGEWASSVAGELTFEGRFGVSVDEDLPAARRALEQAIRNAADADDWLREHRPVVTWWGAQYEPARIASDDPIVRTVCGAYERVQGRAARVEGVPYGADMRLLVNQGRTPTVIFGPGDVRGAHRPDEHIAIDDLRVAAKTLALTAVRFCGIVP